MNGNPYGTNMVIREPDPFFGTIGNLIAQYGGLMAPGMDGNMTPIFRSNIFGMRDPNMTGQDYYMSNVYSRRMSSVMGSLQRSLARSAGAMFNSRSPLGAFFGEVDANGSPVQSPFTLGGFGMLRNFATSSTGASMLNNLVNASLGYDRGAGASVFAQNIDSIFARSPSMQSLFTTAANGRRVYDAGGVVDLTNTNYQGFRATGASLLENSLQNAMYGDGFIKDWGITHGVSEGLAAQIVSDAARNGVFSKAHRSSMSKADQERKRKIEQDQRALKKNNRLLSEYEEAIRMGGPGMRDVYADSIEAINKENARRRESIAQLQSEISTFDSDYNGDFEDLTRRAIQQDIDMKKAVDEQRTSHRRLNGLFNRRNKLLEGWKDKTEEERDKIRDQLKPIDTEIRSAYQEVYRKDGELAAVTREQDSLSKELDGVMKSVLKSVTSAVDTAKAIFGSEQEAYNALYQMTGGTISSNKGVAQSMDVKMTQFLEAGTVAGLSNNAMAQLLQGTVAAVAGGRVGIPAAYAHDFISTSLGMNAATAAALGMTNGNLTEAERKNLPEAAAWMAGEFNRNTTANAISAVQLAYEEGSLNEADYKKIMANLMSSDDTTRNTAFRRYASVMFNGDVQKAWKFINNDAQMAIVRDKVSDKATVADLISRAGYNETQAVKYLSRGGAELDQIRGFASRSGMSGDAIMAIENSGSLGAARDRLRELAGKGNKNAAQVLSRLASMDEDLSDLSVAERRRKEAEWLEEYGSSYLGEAASDVMGEYYRGGANALSDKFEGAVGVSAAGGLASIIGGKRGAYIRGRGKRMTRGNMMRVGNVVFGDEGRGIAVTEAERRAFEESRNAYNEAIGEGNYDKAMGILNRYSSGLSRTGRELLGRVVDENVAFTGDNNPITSKTYEEAAGLLFGDRGFSELAGVTKDTVLSYDDDSDVVKNVFMGKKGRLREILGDSELGSSSSLTKGQIRKIGAAFFNSNLTSDFFTGVPAKEAKSRFDKAIAAGNFEEAFRVVRDFAEGRDDIFGAPDSNGWASESDYENEVKRHADKLNHIRDLYGSETSSRTQKRSATLNRYKKAYNEAKERGDTAAMQDIVQKLYDNMTDEEREATGLNYLGERKDIAEQMRVMFGDDSTITDGMSDEEKKKYNSVKKRVMEAWKKGDKEAAHKIANEYYAGLSDDKKGKIRGDLSARLRRNGRAGMSGTTMDLETARKTLEARGEEVTVTSLNAIMHSDDLLTESDPIAAARKQERVRQAKANAYASNMPGAESIIAFMQGTGSFSDIFRNGNMSKSTFHETAGAFFNNMGFADGDIKSAAIMDLFTEGGATSTSAGDIASSLFGVASKGKEGDIKNLASMFGLRGQNFKDFVAGMTGAGSSVTLADRNANMSNVFKVLSEQAQIQANDLESRIKSSKDPAERSKMEKRLQAIYTNLGMYQNVQTGISSGNIDLGGAGVRNNGSGDMTELIAKISELIDALKANNSDNGQM